MRELGGVLFCPYFNLPVVSSHIRKFREASALLSAVIGTKNTSRY